MASNTFVKSMEAHILNFIFRGDAITWGGVSSGADQNRSVGLFYLDAPTAAWDEYGSLYPAAQVTADQYTSGPAPNVIYEPLQGGANDTGYLRQEITFSQAATSEVAAATATPRSLANNLEVTFPVCSGANYFAAAAKPTGGTYAQTDGSNGLVSSWAVFAYEAGSITSTAAINGQTYPIITGLFTTPKAILVDDQAKIAANNLTITLD